LKKGDSVFSAFFSFLAEETALLCEAFKRVGIYVLQSIKGGKERRRLQKKRTILRL